MPSSATAPSTPACATCYRKWTLEDLIEACSEALYEYEGIDRA
jgi:hypothetical protein